MGFVAGSRFDPPNKTGLSETVASLLKEGTSTRNSRQIAEELADIGANLDASSSADGITVSRSSSSGRNRGRSWKYFSAIRSATVRISRRRRGICTVAAS